MLAHFNDYLNWQLNNLEKVDASKQVISKRKLLYENSNLACICGREIVKKFNLLL